MFYIATGKKMVNQKLTLYVLVKLIKAADIPSILLMKIICFFMF